MRLAGTQVLGSPFAAFPGSPVGSDSGVEEPGLELALGYEIFAPQAIAQPTVLQCPYPTPSFFKHPPFLCLT